MASKQAIISVYDRTHVAGLMHELHARDWHMHATSGTASHFFDHTGESVDLLSDLAAASASSVLAQHREMTAQIIAGLIASRRNPVDLVCVNLRPPRITNGSIDTDVGGTGLLLAACKTDALVVTNPNTYEAVLEEIRSPQDISPEFRLQLQAAATQHITDHMTQASALAYRPTLCDD